MDNVSVTPELPLVSIVTPTLDRAEHLVGLIASVRDQTYTNIEHIVIDGGSSDATTAILERHEGARFRWVSEPDAGIYDAVNKGFRLASGDIHCYLNTDDRFFPYSVEAAVEGFNRHPEVGLLFGDLAAYDEQADTGWINFYPRRISAHLRRGGLLSQPTAFWRASAGRATGEFDVSLRLASDIDYWVRMTRSFKARKLDEILAYEGHHSERLTSGREAVERAHDELSQIKQRERAASAAGMRRDVISTKIALAWAHRASTVRFLWSARRAGKGEPGTRWSGFLAAAGSSVDRRSLFLSLIPGVGRRHRMSVLVRRPVDHVASSTRS